jgi:hypothetical protein
MNKTLLNLHAEIADLESKLKLKKSKYNDILEQEYGEILQGKFNAKVEPFGVTHTFEDGYKISGSVDKKVTWDQDKLSAIYSKLNKPDDYINVKFDVSESKFKAWPSELQEEFIDARTVKPAPMKITITEQKDEQNA